MEFREGFGCILRFLWRFTYNILVRWLLWLLVQCGFVGWKCAWFRFNAVETNQGLLLLSTWLPFTRSSHICLDSFDVCFYLFQLLASRLDLAAPGHLSWISLEHRAIVIIFVFRLRHHD